MGPMAKAYFERLDALLRPVARSLPPEVALEIKHFFGGAAAHAQGRICITLTPAGLALKLPEDARGRLMKTGAKPLRYFPKGPIKKDYVVIPRGFEDDRRKLKHWARKAIDHALTLPRPTRRPRKAHRS